MKITFIVGLPGSGKTHFAKKLDGFLIDDITSTKQLEGIASASLIVVDVHLCMEEVRRKAFARVREMFPECEVDWIFFENNMKQCLRNIKQRNDGRIVEGAVRMLSKYYKVPEGFKAIPVWNSKSRS